VLHYTGDYDYNLSFLSLSRSSWDSLVDRFLNIPALITKEAVNAMAPVGARNEPKKFINSEGVVIIVGPRGPIGNKVSGLVRARSEVFRGALRPYVATVNQELRDVLRSNIKVCLILPGSVEGNEPNSQSLLRSLLFLASGSSIRKNESIFYIDEARA
jgi:hypothetical protein